MLGLDKVKSLMEEVYEYIPHDLMQSILYEIQKEEDLTDDELEHELQEACYYVACECYDGQDDPLYKLLSNVAYQPGRSQRACGGALSSRIRDHYLETKGLI
jgi:hypothetical protein